MAKNTIIMIGDGMGWEMARAAAIWQEIQNGAEGNTLSDFYTEGTGTGLSFQNLLNYGLVTTYGTTIAGEDGIYNTSNSALEGSQGDRVTGEGEIRDGFEFDPTFNPGVNRNGGADANAGVEGNLVGYDPVRGKTNPWDPAYYGGETGEGFDPEYIKLSYPDSANTATTLYTGTKTYNGAVGVDIFEQPVESILTKAANEGKATGLVSSVPIDHATPGAAAANVNSRGKLDEFGVIDTILQQELGIYQPTVLLGGGHPLSNVDDPLPEGVEPPNGSLEPTEFRYLSEGTYNELRNNPTDNIYGYTFLERGEDAAEVLANTAAGIDPEAGERLLGVYGARGQNGNLPTASADGDFSTTGFEQFTLGYSSEEFPLGVGDTQRPLLPGETDEEFIARERNENPTLNQLVEASLDVLEDDPDGFWLLVEGGDIDWAAHDNNMDNLIGNMLEFDKSVQTVINWVEANGGWEENELIITADHDHYLTLNENFPQLLREQGPNALTYGLNAQDPDDASDYDASTPDAAGHFWGSDSDVKHGWTNHTNRPVPVYYQGPNSEILTNSVGEGYEAYGEQIPGIDGLVDQVHIAEAMSASVQEDNEFQLVSGTAGNDELISGIGDFDGKNDTIFTGAGNDEIDLAFGDGRKNRANGGSGDDTIYVSRRDRVFGGAGNDEFDATEGMGKNRMSGGMGDDTFYLGMDDRALGGEGNDKFFVQSGGDNILSGGEGADQFWIVNAEIPESMNTIVDFEMGTDVIGISGSVGISGFADLTLTEMGGNTEIAFGGNALAMLNGVTGLEESSFAFA